MQSLSTIDAQQSMIKFISAFPRFADQTLTASKLADGHIFATILLTVPNFHIVLEPLDPNTKNWTHKLKNLRKLLDQLEDYFEKILNKGIKTDDIDLVSIAKNNDMESLTRLFEVVMSVLMQSSNKEDYIEIIMNLDQKSQSNFVKIIQNAMQHRTTSIEQLKNSKFNSLITHYQAQNASLQQYIQDLIHSNQQLKKSNTQLQNQIKLIQQQAEFTAESKAGSNFDHSQHENEQLKNMVSNLKEKLIKTAIQHQTELAKIKDQYNALENKNLQLSQVEQEYNQLKTQLEENNEKLNKAHNVQKEKLKLMRVIDQKDSSIKKQQQKIQQLTTKIYKMEEKQLQLTMELKKKQTKMKGFQKEVKEKIQTANSNGLDLSIPNLDISTEEILKEDIQQYKNDLTKRQQQVENLEKQIKQLQKKAQKVQMLENEKKKLENAIRQLDKIKTEEINILITISSQLRDDNARLMEEGKKIII